MASLLVAAVSTIVMGRWLARLLDPENPPGVAGPVGQLLSGDARSWAGKMAQLDSYRIGLPPVTASLAPEI